MTMARSIGIAALGAALAAGCGKKSNHGGHDDHVAKAPDQPLTAALFGAKVAPPGILAKTKWDATVAQTQAAAPELFDPKGKTKLVDDPAIKDVSYSVSFDRTTQKLSHMYLEMPAADAAMLATAWGPGKSGADNIGRPETFWFDPASGWRAWTEPSFEPKSINLNFSPYVPAGKLLGDGVDQLGFAPQGILGATLADLRTRFGVQLIEEDQQQAEQNRKDLNKMMGSNLDGQLGAAKPSVHIELPPTELAEFWTRIQLDWDDSGKVGDTWFDIAYGPVPATKPEIKALFDKKWGTPKPGHYLGQDVMIYKDTPPTVTVRDDTISNAWEVRVSTAEQKD